MLRVVCGVRATALAVSVAASVAAAAAGASGQLRPPTEAARAVGPDVAPLEELASPAPPVLARRPRPETVVFAQAVPSAARGAYRRALGRYRKGRGEEARRALEDAVGRFPDYFDANLALGVVCGASGDYGRAEAALSAALRVNAREPRAHLFRAVALVGLADAERAPGRERERLAEAAAELDRAWDLSARTLPVVHLQRARVLERLGDRAGAADALDRYVEAVPGAPSADALRKAAATLRGH